MEYGNLTKLYYKNKIKYDQTYARRYHGEETMRFNFEIRSNPAFLVLTNEINQLIISILKGNSQLMYCIGKLPKEALLQFERKCLIEEIKVTNDIEGVASTRKEIEEALEAIQSKNKERKRLTGIVNKYLLLQRSPAQQIFSCQDIRDIYDELVLKEVEMDNPNHVPDGILFRKDPVFVQKNQQVIHTGITPESQIIAHLDAGLKIINDSAITSLISTSVFHYLFGYVHPFYDGNGRMGRYLSSILLSKDVTFLVSYNLSNVINQHIKLYYKAFEMTNEKKNKGDLTPFVTIFLSFIDEAVEQMSESLDYSMRQYEHFRSIIEQGKFPCNENKSGKALLSQMLINTLFASRGMDIKELAEKCNVTESTIRNNLRKMGKDMLRIHRDGHKFLYDLNLEFLEEYPFKAGK